MSVRSELNIPTAPTERNRAFIDGTQAVVNQLAKTMGVPPVEVRIPPYGFLLNELTEDEKKALDNELGPIYAAESVQFQDEVMKIPIHESMEKMVSLKDVFANAGLTVKFSELGYHEACGEWAGKPRIFWVREQVAERLVTATRALNTLGLTLFFHDAFRPPGVQEGLFKRRMTQYIMREHPEWPWEQKLLEARSKTGINPRLSGHKGGASVDASLYSLVTDKLLPLGTGYPESGATVALDFPYLTREQWATRQIFSAVLTMTGLTPYKGEDWHGSFGDNLAGDPTDSDYVAIFGPIKGFDHETGEIYPYDPSEYNTPFYTEAQLKDFAG